MACIKQNIIWEIHRGKKGPLVATAIHNGHRVRREVEKIMALSDDDRLREEDPFTWKWTDIGNTQIIGTRSRFEVDLNRPREKSVYINPEDAWGLKIWKSKPSREVVTCSLKEYNAFYTEMKRIFTDLEQQFGCFVVFDLHSFNYRREGPNALPDDPEKNPEVNVGTGTMDRKLWRPLINRFISDLHAYDYCSRHLDVRENVKFKGGQFSRWIHQTFAGSACSLAIEFKKFFMDEWTGKPDNEQIEEIRSALQSTVPGVLEELKKLGANW